MCCVILLIFVDFSYLLSVPSVFNNFSTNCSDGIYNDTTFANDVVKYLPADVASTCIYTLCSLKESASAFTKKSLSESQFAIVFNTSKLDTSKNRKNIKSSREDG